jgi:hypothetical protein
MRFGNLGKWHIWLGWLIGVPLILWTASGLLMVSRPIEEVRGEHLRVTSEAVPMPFEQIVLFADNGNSVTGARLLQSGRSAVWLVDYADGSAASYDARSGKALAPLSAAKVKHLARASYAPDAAIVAARFFPASQPPFDFRRDADVWQVRFADGTNLYLHPLTGEVLSVRTRFWRIFDFAWGLHIMDLQSREDTHHPLLIGFAALALMGSLLGFVLLFRRRGPRRKTR